ncbi:ribosomal RNA small subunit methyltransferase A [Endomicrobium proavitum]|uniref:Ribosomal RNA small subunit methyltransferase A n=1 Tax=Endomicrobium proavitum TaxID=1408281 RepID=A0A0G3WJM8_9BACT|nr:rRNA adenine dimethyltransferase family protein [Endomicrobium proavitum]AKL98488.1 dimethyladenosine 16S ribosomal RNA transferase [Endomicrobium proavitum]
MRQKHGQNFLTDNNIINNIIKAAALTKDDEVLEIGPGKGALTKIIAPQVKHLTAVEIDKILFQQLNYYFDFHKTENVTLINEDFLKLQSGKWKVESEINGKSKDKDEQQQSLKQVQGDQSEKWKVESGINGKSKDKDEQQQSLKQVQGDSVVEFNRVSRCHCETLVSKSAVAVNGAVNSTFHFPLSTLPFKVVSNLPYNVGTAIIQKILPTPNWTTCVFMLQKEVNERLAAPAGSKDYGYISIFTQYYANAQIMFDVSPRCFTPQPKVTSSVIKLTNKNAPPPNKNFFPFVKHAFAMRRKTILNAVSSFANLDKTQTAKILQEIKIDPMLRPEKLSIENFLQIITHIPQ